MLAAPGMCPAALGGLAHARRRDDLAVELGRAAHVHEGEIAGIAQARQDVVAEGAQGEVGGAQGVARGRVRRHVGRERQALVQPVLAPAIEDAHVGMAVELQLPVRPRGEPVVVVAVQHDRGVGRDAAVRQERPEVGGRGDVAADAVGELAGPVPADGTRQVALAVRGGVHVDLDEAHRRVVEMGARPVGVDEGGAAGVSGVGHGMGSSG